MSSNKPHINWCLGCFWCILITFSMCFTPTYGRGRGEEEAHARRICTDMNLGIFQALNGAYCCLCPNGEYFIKDCGSRFDGEPDSRICTPCPFDIHNPSNQTYMDVQNNRTECFKSLEEDACEKFQNTIREPGNSSSNARCVCKENHISVNSDVEGGCYPQNCEEGFQPTSDGMKCEPCPPHFFSNESSRAKCLPWTNCKSRKILKNGTRESDVQCKNDVPSSNLANAVYNTTDAPEENVTSSTQMEIFRKPEGLAVGQKVGIGVGVLIFIIIVIIIIWFCKCRTRRKGESRNRGAKVCYIAERISLPKFKGRPASEGRRSEVSDNAAQKSKEKRSKSTQNDPECLANSRDEVAPGPSGKNKHCGKVDIVDETEMEGLLKSEHKSTPETENAMSTVTEPAPSVPDADKTTKSGGINCTDKMETEKTLAKVEGIPSDVEKVDEPFLSMADEEKKGTSEKENDEVHGTETEEVRDTVQECAPAKAEAVPFGVPCANGAPRPIDMTHIQCLTQQERRTIEDLGVPVGRVWKWLIDPQFAKDILKLLAEKYDTDTLLPLFRLLHLTNTNISDIKKEHQGEKQHEIRLSMIEEIGRIRGDDLTLQLIFKQDFYKELRDFAFKKFVSRLDVCHGN